MIIDLFFYDVINLKSIARVHNLKVKDPPTIKPIDLKSDHLNETNLANRINAIFWKEYPLFSNFS